MDVDLNGISRKFGRQFIFQNVSHSFKQGEKHALLGGNGSGKSTLLRIIYGALTPSQGTILYQNKNGEIPRDTVPFKISIAAPYLELIEELTALEFLSFYNKFKPLQKGISPSELLNIAYLKDSAHKEIRNFSSGMKQRLRIALAFYSDTSLILLDEPTSNLDPQGVEWFKSHLNKTGEGKTVIIGSNFNEDEIGSCNKQLKIDIYK